MEIENWFKGFEKGLERLSPEQRSVFFSECGRNCVNGGTLSVYQQLHDRAQGDMDTFFQMANELQGVRGGVVEKGRGSLRKDVSIGLSFWNALVNCARKGMSQHLCFVNVHAKA